MGPVSMLYPFKFHPIPVTRVWGGRTLADLDKPLPPGDTPVGESWEISDRDEAQSIVANGPLKDRTLHDLVASYGPSLLGTRAGTGAGTMRFPLLVKLLDARQRLSLQVHPPAAVAPRLNGEPKTEMWYILEADPSAHLIAGLEPGITRDRFEAAIRDETLEQCVHRFPVKSGDAIFIPSGRLHAIDAGLLIVEIQQNSDTTYRVYDWGRVGLDGQPRELHLSESLQSIDFDDTRPGLAEPVACPVGANRAELLVECEHFRVSRLELAEPWEDTCDGSSFQVVCGISHQPVRVVTAQGHDESVRRGEFLLLPADLGAYQLVPGGNRATVLTARLP